MQELSIVKITMGEWKDSLGEIQSIRENHVKSCYVVFNNGEGDWFSSNEINLATKEEEVIFLRNEVSELHKLADELDAAYNCLEFDFKLLLKTIENPNEQTIRIAEKRGFGLNPRTKTKRIFPPIEVV
ncbi:hypothetical protein CON36_33305 [Bacillus cereus]|uniref:Uncharacterized protein n=1 Tax=Bacillus cereus TaxID=1396 RepID=A0A9X6XVS1_BACCE|nr:hypothetical protein [Bacillus cereus]PDZ94536.1 hypothetical protein CON36_33305 [Bacillus cereus]PGP14428.1 hypothetical protein COA01_29115 [Bacillus cereus]